MLSVVPNTNLHVGNPLPLLDINDDHRAHHTMLNGAQQSSDDVLNEIAALIISAYTTPLQEHNQQSPNTAEQDNNKLNVLSEIPYSSGNDPTDHSVLDTIEDVFMANEDQWGGEPPNKLRSWPSNSSFSSGYSSDSPGCGGGNPEELSLSDVTKLASYDALGPTGKHLEPPCFLNDENT